MNRAVQRVVLAVTLLGTGSGVLGACDGSSSNNGVDASTTTDAQASGGRAAGGANSGGSAAGGTSSGGSAAGGARSNGGGTSTSDGSSGSGATGGSPGKEAGAGGASGGGTDAGDGASTNDGGLPTKFACAPTTSWVREDRYPDAEGGDIIALWSASSTDVWESRGKHGYIEHYDGTGWTEVPLSAGNVVTAIHGSAANDVWAVGTAGLVAHYDGSKWSCPARPTTANLVSISVNGPNDAWALGENEMAVAGLAGAPVDPMRRGLDVTNGNVLHWNGKDWSRDAFRDQNCSLNTNGPVWSSGPSDLWVLYRMRCSASQQRVLARWNGTTWEVMRTSLASGGGDPYFTAGWASAPDNAVVTENDSYQGPNGFSSWNGMKWADSTDHTNFNGVWGSGPKDIWLVADTKNTHWNGTALQDGTPGAKHVTGSSATNAWLYGPGGNRRHWDGKTLEDASSNLSTTPRDEGIAKVWGSGSDAVWGITSTTGHVLRRTSTGWVATGSPANLKGVWGTGPNDLYAVGAGGDAIHHYDGQSWTQTSIGAGVELNSIWGNASKDVWVVGNAKSDGSITPRYYSTTLHYDGSSWKGVPVQAAGAGTTTAMNLYAVHGTAANNVWANGDTGLLHWDGKAWVNVGGQASHFVWVGGPDPSDVLTSGTVWGTSTTDRFEFFPGTVLDTAASIDDQRAFILEYSDGKSTMPVVTGLDQTETDPDPGTYSILSSIWVGPKDVYLVGSTGITLHLAR